MAAFHDVMHAEEKSRPNKVGTTSLMAQTSGWND